MNNYHIEAKQEWDGFSHDGDDFCLKHLSSHEVYFDGKKDRYKFIVTYGLHCFAKSEVEHSISLTYSDAFETREINLERYHLSKYLKGFIEGLGDKKKLYETAKEKYFTFERINDLTDNLERCKVCLCIFKENRLLRIHVTSAFFDREAKGIDKKGYSIFKLAMDAKEKPRRKNIPKEATRG